MSPFLICHPDANQNPTVHGMRRTHPRRFVENNDFPRFTLSIAVQVGPVRVLAACRDGGKALLQANSIDKCRNV